MKYLGIFGGVIEGKDIVDAPGAWPKGTRVKKVRTREGDSRPIGATAVVAGSVLIGQLVGYYVHWEGETPPAGFISFVMGHKLEKL